MHSIEDYLVAPVVAPHLDPTFRPAALAWSALQKNSRIPVGLALEQADGSTLQHHFLLLDPAEPGAEEVNAFFAERLVKFLLWSWGGWRLHFAGPTTVAEALRRHYLDSAPGRFDSETIGHRIYGRPLEIVPVASVSELPPPRLNTAPLGRHWEGCRIGFDLGGSDRKVAAVVDGKCVFSEEVVWDPYFQPDPQYHFDGIMDSLRRAAAHLPKVDAIGGSAAGVYVNNRVRVSSLFRGVPADLFERRIKDLFVELKAAWGGIPFEVVNDGEVTALVGAMSLGENAVLGLAMGTSTAAGFVTPEGAITSGLNELAFVPIDYRADAPRDEWSGDIGVGSQYFSQQAVARLLAPAGVEVDPKLSFAERLKVVQGRMANGDSRAANIYQSIGVFLGYGIAQFATFYPFRHVLVLGRVLSGPGGDLILDGAREVLAKEFPELGHTIALHLPDESDRRHGQAIAAASLPVLP